MLKQFKEKDFYIIKEVSTGRLRPEAMIGFFWGAIIYGGIMTLFSWLVVRDLSLETQFWPNFLNGLYALLFIQLIFTFFFSSEKRAYKYQSAQSYFLIVVSFKASVEMYLAYFLLCEDRQAPAYMTTVGLFFLAGGFLFFLLSILRVVNRVKNGEFKETGRGIFNFKESKGYVSTPIIYAAAVFGGLLAKATPSMGLSSVGEVIVPLLLSILLQYAIAMAWPEFLLLAYCKKRFPSFHYIPKRYQ